MRKLERMTEKLRATVGGQTNDPEHLLDVLIAAWEEMHREAKEPSGVRAVTPQGPRPPHSRH